MPAGNRQQSNAMLYTVITFVSLFIISTTVAVIYYVNYEEQRDLAVTSQNELNQTASLRERQKVGAIVGAKLPGKSTLGTMLDYFDDMIAVITGGVAEETSAEVKSADVHRQLNDLLKKVEDDGIDIEKNDPNRTGVVRIANQLKNLLDDSRNSESALKDQINDLQKRFDDAVAESNEKEKVLLEEKDKYAAEVEDIKTKYNDLKQLLEQSSEERVKNLMTQLNDQQENSRKLKEDLLQSQAQFKQAEQRMKIALKQLQEIKPAQSEDVAAYKQDGKIMLVDNQLKVVHLNIGSNDKVYRGLTFPVYDRNVPIPKDGKSKAEIEVFNVEKNTSIARIVKSQIKNPIAEGDIIANLVWDSKKTNIFVLAGDFDLNGDGKIDPQAKENLELLIQKWGGKVDDTVSVNTDFVVLGQTPKILRKPTFEELEMYPLAMEKYQASVKMYDDYKKTENSAQSLSIPIFNFERFLYLIGYKTQSQNPGAF